jgi:hypothetical protein
MTVKDLNNKVNRLIEIISKITKLPEHDIRAYCDGGETETLIYSKHLTSQTNEAINP